MNSSDKKELDDTPQRRSQQIRIQTVKLLDLINKAEIKAKFDADALGVDVEDLRLVSGKHVMTELRIARERAYSTLKMLNIIEEDDG